jgi:acetyl-CoA carboxylase biotin carboxyl carrier protein
MDERPGESGGVQPREQQREGATAQQPESPEARAQGRGRDERSRRDPRHRRGGGGQGGGRERQQPQGGAPQQQRPEASLNMDELRELFDLFTAQGFTEFELEKENFRIRLRRDLAPQGAPGPAHLAPVPAPQQPAHVIPFVAPQPQPQQATPAAHAGPQPAQAQAEPGKPAAADAPAAEADLHVITSPIVGTFYRAASPTSEPFVRAGSHVEPDTVVCIIEAMKLMNEIQAEVSGAVEKIYVENGQPVEYGQPLFGIKNSDR